MNTIKAQYFLVYAVLGCLSPFLPVYFEQVGLTRPEIGYALAAASLSPLVMPALAGLLADLRADRRPLIAGVFLIAAATLAAMLFVRGFWPNLILYTLHCLVFTALTPLQDGLYFSVAAATHSNVPYHRVRVWGTIGFILPSLVLFAMLFLIASPGLVLAIGVAFCLLGAVNAMRLPTVPREASLPRHAKSADAPPGQLPTTAAARELLKPHLFLYCVGMFLAGLAAAAYYQCYPLYLTSTVGIDKKWVGLIASVGVVVEIFFVYEYSRLERAVTLRWIIILGMLAMSVRMLLLFAFPSIGIAIASQLFHGMSVLMLNVTPPTYLNRHAQPWYRSSMQGLFTVSVNGVSRVIGNAAIGHIAKVNLPIALAVGSALAALAACFTLATFREKPQQ